MPVSTEKNFEEKFELFKEWLTQQDSFKDKGHLISANESSIASGFSNETFIFSLEENDEIKNFVLRLKPTNYQVFPEYNLKLQVDIMRCLHNRGFPAPNVILYESNEGILGSEFYLMDYINGEAPSDNPPYHMDPKGMVGKAVKEDRRKIWTEWIHYLNQIHILDVDDLGLTELESKYGKNDPIDIDIEYYQDFLNWGMDGEDNPLCDDVLNWLRENKPKKNNPLSLCWGDSRPGNILYENFKATALLDWEMASYGDPISDVAWCLAVDDASSLGLTIERLEGSMDYKEALDIWSSKTGFSQENYEYYRIFSLLKFSVIMVRVAKKLVFNKIMPLESDFYKNNYISNFLKSEFKTKVNL
ncbi:MAG: phosphotransferase family protein [Pseudomonadota bacterium]|nr:phosphotransferase family protein [Pseudomonadota bacterium]